jgi:hypothetical protein
MVEPFDVRPKIQVLPFNVLCTFFAHTMPRRRQHLAVRLPVIGIVASDVIVSKQFIAQLFAVSIGTTTILVRQDAFFLGIPRISCPSLVCLRADKRPELIKFRCRYLRLASSGLTGILSASIIAMMLWR